MTLQVCCFFVKHCLFCSFCLQFAEALSSAINSKGGLSASNQDFSIDSILAGAHALSFLCLIAWVDFWLQRRRPTRASPRLWRRQPRTTYHTILMATPMVFPTFHLLLCVRCRPRHRAWLRLQRHPPPKDNLPPMQKSRLENARLPMCIGATLQSKRCRLNSLSNLLKRTPPLEQWWKNRVLQGHSLPSHRVLQGHSLPSPSRL